MISLYIKRILLSLLIFSLMGCLPPSEEKTANGIQGTLAMPTPLVAATATPPPPPIPQPTAVSEANFAPIFHNIRFATAPDAPTTAVFPAGTPEIFALWDYVHIPTDTPATMRRVWRFNGEAWLDRQEPWDLAQYGSSGTMSTISIYDFEGNGLESGSYDVELYLDGQLLLTGSFIVQTREPFVSATNETGGTMIAMNETELMLITQDGRFLKFIDTNHPISEIVWLPSNDKVIFVTRDSSEQIADSTLGIKHALWFLKLGTFEAVPLGFYDEDFHEVGVSENGRYLSLIAGTSYGDACFVDRHFYIMQLNDDGQRTNLYDLTQFSGTPHNQGGQTHDFYPANSGHWLDSNQLTLEIAAACLTDEDAQTLPGRYQLDVTNLTATRIGN